MNTQARMPLAIIPSGQAMLIASRKSCRRRMDDGTVAMSGGHAETTRRRLMCWFAEWSGCRPRIAKSRCNVLCASCGGRDVGKWLALVGHPCVPFDTSVGLLRFGSCDQPLPRLEGLFLTITLRLVLWRLDVVALIMSSMCPVIWFCLLASLPGVGSCPHASIFLDLSSISRAGGALRRQELGLPVAGCALKLQCQI